jgi:energy-coupling factor transport system ATP-binding protein
MALIDIQNFTYTYPLTKNPVLKGINLQVEEGEFVAILGPNGAGKSSLCYAISGFLKHFFRGEYQGKILIDGQDLDTSNLYKWVRNVGLVFQNPFTQLSGSKFTVFEEIAFGLENFGVPYEEMKERIDLAMRRIGISDLADRSPYSLSGGQQQRVAIASIFVLEPRILVLDEPTSQLDPIGAREVFQTIKNMSSEGKTVLMVEHKIEWIAQFADRVIVLQDGEIVLEGRPHEVLTNERLNEIGVHTTHFTSVARKAINRGLWPPERPLPVTLQEALEGFEEEHHGH